MDRGGRGMRRTRGGRPFIRGFYRGRKGSGRVMRSRSRTSCSRDRYGSYDNDHSDSHEERSWDSPPGTDKDISKEKHERENSSPTRNKWEKDDDANDKNDEHYKEKKDYYHDSKHYRRSTGYSYRGRRPYQNNYWDRSDRGGRHYSPQSQYRVRPYHTPPRHRRYSRSPDRRRSPSRYRSRSRTPSRSRRYSPKSRSPKRRSPSIRDSRRSKSPNECGQSTEKNETINNSDDENNSDDFVEKLKASKGSKTPGRLNYAENSDDDDYWIEAEKNDTKDAKKSNRPDYSSIGSKTPGRQEIFDYSSKGSKTPGRQEIPDYSSKGSKTPGRQEIFDYSSKGSKTPGRQEIPDYSSKGSKTPGRQETSDYSSKGSKTPGRQETSDYSSKGSKTPGRQELSNNDKDEYWVKSQTSHNMPSTKNVYSSSWDDSPIHEKSVPSKVPKTPGRKDYSSKDNDDYWINSSSNDSKKDRSSNDLYSKKTINKDSSIMYVQELSSSDSEPKKPSKRPRSVSLTNSDKSDTPPLNTEPSNKVGTRYSQASTRVSNTVLKEPPPPSIPATSSSLPVYNSQWPGLQNVSSPYSSTVNYSQPQTSQFTAYQQQPQVPVQNSQWYQPGYQQYGTSFQQFQKYDQKSVYSQPVHSNLEPVEGYQSTNQGLYNIDLKQVVDITKPPPTITPITTTVSASPDTQTKNSQDNIFEMQREVYTTKLFSLKKELETLQIQYDTFKSDNSDGRHNNELKKNRKAQDDVNGKIKGVNNILEVVNTMIPKDSLKDIKKVEQKKITTESESLKTIHQEESTTIHKHRRQSISSSSSVEVKKKKIKPIKSKKTLKVQSSDEDEEINTKKYKSKEYIDTNKKKTCFEKLPQFNYIYCDSCIHWCQPCNIFPKTAKEYLTHLHSDSHKTTLEELNVVELPWHDTLTEPTQPGKNAELPTKRVPIKGLEFFIGTSAWYCKLCDTWIGDLHCASAHFKSKTHNDLYAELMEKEPTWEIDWLTKRTRAFEKCFSQTNMMKYDEIKENKTKGNVTESKIERSFFEKEPKRDKEKEKLRERDRDRDRDRDRYKKESSRKNIDLKSQLSPDKESNDTNNVSISDWMKPVDLPVEKSMITLKESVQKSKDKLNKNKIEEIDNFKSNISTNNHVIKKKTEEPKLTTVHDKKDESFNSSHRNKIKLPFIGKMPFAKPITKKTNSIKDIPNFTVETKVDEPKDNHMDSVTFQKMFIEKMISAANDKKIEKQILPVDMDIDDDNENNTILSSITDSTEVQLNSMQTGNQMHQIYNQPQSNILPQDLSTALNMIFPCNETSVNTSINSQIHNPLINQHFNMSYDVTNNSNLNSPERKKKKNAPSQRKRRHMKKIMGKEDSNKDEYDEDDNSETPIIQGPKEETIRKSNGNESEGDELAMLGIDAEDMAAQYY